jgi:D-serine deaminase-like pyridoxal phosphate-dependent protein
MPLPLKLLEPVRKIKADLDKHGATFRLMIDNPAQIKGLEAGLKAAGEQDQVWSIYLKLDIGSK